MSIFLSKGIKRWLVYKAPGNAKEIRSSKLPAPGKQGREECLLPPSWNNLEVGHKG